MQLVCRHHAQQGTSGVKRVIQMNWQQILFTGIRGLREQAAEKLTIG